MIDLDQTAKEQREGRARLTWVVLYSQPCELPAEAPDDQITHRPDWWEAFVPGDPDAGGVGAWKMSMVTDWLAGLGLRRVDREPDDHWRVIERWVPTVP